jgi:hypothetical protein
VLASWFGQSSDCELELLEPVDPDDWLCEALGVSAELDWAHAFAAPIPPTTSVLAASVPATIARRTFEVISSPPSMGAGIDGIPSTGSESALWRG